MTVQTTAGAKLFIAEPGVVSDPGNPWVEIGEITNFGALGRVYELIQHASVANRNTRKFKGTRNDGAMPIEFGKDMSDAGQQMLDEAKDDDENYNFQIRLQNGDTITFQALTMSFVTNVGTANQIVGGSANLEIQTGTITEEEY